MTFLDMLLRLGLAVAAGGLVGIERERTDRPAGLRTHMLVCTGSTLFTLVSLMATPEGGDATRIAAQIVSGIGFLGAGTIFRSESGVRGLTTAAGLWVVAGIGMGIGAGGELLWLALVTAVLVYAVNRWIRGVEHRVFHLTQGVVLTLQHGEDVLARIFSGLADRGAELSHVHWLRGDAQTETGVVRLDVKLPADMEPTALISWISSLPGVREVELV